MRRIVQLAARRRLRAGPRLLPPPCRRRRRWSGTAASPRSGQSSPPSSPSCSARRGRRTTRSTQRHKDIARLAAGDVRGGVLPSVWTRCTRDDGLDGLCLAGGCAHELGRQRQDVRAQRRSGDVYVQAAAGDAGGAIGAAFVVWNQVLGAAARLRHGPRLLGPGVRRRRCSRGEIEQHREAFARSRLPDRRDIDGRGRALPTGRGARSPTARSSAGSRAGWSGGRGRSATAPSSCDPRRADMKDILNRKIKRREIVPPLRAVDPARGGRRTGSRRDYDVPFMMQVYPDPRGEAGADPGRDARRRLGPAADRATASRTRATIG